MELKRFAETGVLARAAAELVVNAAKEATAARGAFHFALSGGSTPKALYALLAQEPFRSRIDWSKVQIWFGDERCVPPDHADSNYRMARESMLATLALPESQVHRIRGEADPDAEAERFADEMKRSIPLANGVPVFDLALLGMGTDGHTASLFPGTGAVLVRDRVALAVMPGAYVKPQVRRVSVSAPVLQETRSLLLLIAGADKTDVLVEVYSGAIDLDKRPLQLVRQAKGDVRWFVDEAAAAKLPR
jgi:6-phosphogluconolactonase